MTSESFRLLADDTIENIVSRLAIQLQLQSELRPLIEITRDYLREKPIATS